MSSANFTRPERSATPRTAGANGVVWLQRPTLWVGFPAEAAPADEYHPTGPPIESINLIAGYLLFAGGLAVHVPVRTTLPVQSVAQSSSHPVAADRLEPGPTGDFLEDAIALYEQAPQDWSLRTGFALAAAVWRPRVWLVDREGRLTETVAFQDLYIGGDVVPAGPEGVRILREAYGDAGDRG